MIIPIRCFTCGKVLANKWTAYTKMIEEKEKEKNEDEPLKPSEHHPNFDPNDKGEILDKLDIKKICCRRHMLGHVEVIDII